MYNVFETVKLLLDANDEEVMLVKFKMPIRICVGEF